MYGERHGALPELLFGNLLLTRLLKVCSYADIFSVEWYYYVLLWMASKPMDEYDA